VPVARGISARASSSSGNFLGARFTRFHFNRR